MSWKTCITGIHTGWNLSLQEGGYLPLGIEPCCSCWIVELLSSHHGTTEECWQLLTWWITTSLSWLSPDRQERSAWNVEIKMCCYLNLHINRRITQRTTMCKAKCKKIFGCLWQMEGKSEASSFINMVTYYTSNKSAFWWANGLPSIWKWTPVMQQNNFCYLNCWFYCLRSSMSKEISCGKTFTVAKCKSCMLIYSKWQC